MHSGLSSKAIVFRQPGSLELRDVELAEPTQSDLVVDVLASGISTGTEKLLWDGTMPAFPGLAYPLVPGYEAVGVVQQAGNDCVLDPGTRVFIPGASCYTGDVRGLFGASASRLVVPETRATPINDLAVDQGTLLALAATAMHILTHQIRQTQHHQSHKLQTIAHDDIASMAPELIVGHGVLGRLLARICLACGAQAPLVWELNPERHSGAVGYDVVLPDDDDITARRHVIDVSGASGDHFNRLIARLAKGGRLTLGGFYNEPVNFDFAPAFMREATVAIASEWVPDDLQLVMSLIESGALSLDGLVSHHRSFEDADEAYPQAFSDPACLKMILEWSVG